jgi:hypothetical protein
VAVSWVAGVKYFELGVANPGLALRLIKLLHTVVWAVFAGAIVVIPIAAGLQRWRFALLLIGVVSLEGLVLAFNRMMCPLTSVAARYTDNRQENFDIYLPLWLARYNKHIFGTLYFGGVMFTIVQWLQHGH